MARLLMLCLALTLGLGVVKLYREQSDPPSYAASPYNSFEGFVAIDGHCHRSQKIRDWLRGDDPGAVELAGFLQRDLHPTALLVPFLVACLSFVIGSIPLGFSVLSALATLAQIWFISVLARRLSAPATGARVCLLAAVLLTAHLDTIRTTAQLYLDPFCALCATLLVLELPGWIRQPDRPRGARIVALQVLGLFLKISYLPMLAVPALATIVAGRFSGPAPRKDRRALRAICLFGLLPLLPWISFLSLGPGSGSFLREPTHLLASWNLRGHQLANFAFEMLLLFQVLPLFLLVRRGVGPRIQKTVVVALACMLLATWAFKLPPIPRLYLPVLGFLVALAAPAIQHTLEGARLRAFVGAYLVLNYAAAIYGIVF